MSDDAGIAEICLGCIFRCICECICNLICHALWECCCGKEETHRNNQQSTTGVQHVQQIPTHLGYAPIASKTFKNVLYVRVRLYKRGYPPRRTAIASHCGFISALRCILKKPHYVNTQCKILSNYT